MPTGYWLIDHPNEHAREWAREKGMDHAFWGYPSRRSPVRAIAVHTAEGAVDFDPPDDGAENVAGYLDSVDRFASYHELVDSDSFVPLLPWDHTAFGVRGFNSPAIHISFATKAHLWGHDPDWDEAALRIAGRRVAEMVRTYDIPLRWLTREQAEAGHKGFVRHSVMDPGRRSDPGDGFPAGRFFELIRTRLEEDDMPDLDEIRAVMREEIKRDRDKDYLWPGHGAVVTGEGQVSLVCTPGSYVWLSAPVSTQVRYHFTDPEGGNATANKNVEFGPGGHGVGRVEGKAHVLHVTVLSVGPVTVQAFGPSEG